MNTQSQPLLFEHADGRRLVALSGTAIVAGDPEWVRQGPVEIEPALRLPRLGEPWPGIPGSLYAGIAPEEDLDGVIIPEGPVVVLPGSMTKVFDQQGCIAWAAAQGEGARAPTQREGTLITSTLRGKLDTSVSWWFWTRTKFGSAYAWLCFLGNGYVNSSGRSAQGGAVAVRRLVLQPFTTSHVVEAEAQR